MTGMIKILQTKHFLLQLLSNDAERITNDVVENDVANYDVVDATTLSFGIKSNRSYRDALLNQTEQG